MAKIEVFFEDDMKNSESATITAAQTYTTPFFYNGGIRIGDTWYPNHRIREVRYTLDTD